MVIEGRTGLGRFLAPYGRRDSAMVAKVGLTDKAQQSLAGRLNSVEIVAKVGFGNDKTARPSLRIAGCGTTVASARGVRVRRRNALG